MTYCEIIHKLYKKCGISSGCEFMNKLWIDMDRMWMKCEQIMNVVFNTTCSISKYYMISFWYQFDITGQPELIVNHIQDPGLHLQFWENCKYPFTYWFTGYIYNRTPVRSRPPAVNENFPPTPQEFTIADHVPNIPTPPQSRSHLRIRWIFQVFKPFQVPDYLKFFEDF